VPPIETPANPPRALTYLWGPIFGLGLTQLIGWGATFTALGILGAPIGRDLDLPREAVFGGVAIMQLISAVLAPSFGRRIDRFGARHLMVPGTLLGALSLLVVAVAHGPIHYCLGWAMLGVTNAMMMSNAAIPALVDIAGPDSRRAVTAHTIVTGVTSTIFLPLTAWLEQRYGWRITLLAFSLMYVVVCLPIHLAVLPEGRVQHPPQALPTPAQSWKGELPPAWRALCFWLIAAWTSLQGFIVWGFNIQVVDILQGVGVAHADAILVWMFAGPAQALSRVGDLMSGGRSGVLTLAIASAVLMPAGFLILVAGGLTFLPALALLAIAAGAGQGLHAVARNLVPLRLFGMETYATTMGRMALPLNICTATAPLVYSVLISRVGAVEALWVTAIASLFSLAAVLALARIAAIATAGTAAE
jgi:predicted MFS family arabinose efflux permease